MKVMKFGGGTVSDGQSMKLAGDVIETHASEDRVAIVLSAIQGVTDQLHEVTAQALKDEAVIDPCIQKLTERHHAVAAEIILDETIRMDTLDRLRAKISRLEKCLYGVSYTEELTPRMNDYIISCGERFSASILAGHLRTRGLRSNAYDGDELGILTDGKYGAATPVMDQVEKNLKEKLVPELEAGAIPVITGYFGCAADGSVTTFGRGGSDYSAAIIAYALEADRLEVWKDVPGFMSADPKVVPAAKNVRRLSYNEAAELAYFGAKILHPRIVEPAVLRDIPILVKNLYDPQAPGSLISDKDISKEWVIQSVAAKRDVALVSLYGPAMANTSGLASQVFDRLGEEDINVYTMAASMASFSLVIDASQADRAVAILEKLRDGIIHRIETMIDVSLICLVGEALRETPGIAGRTFNSVYETGVNVEVISDGGSDIALPFVIKAADEQKALEALHRTFIESRENDSV